MKLEERFPKKRAYITGAASGLGYVIAEELASRGWKLLLSDIDEPGLKKAQDKLSKYIKESGSEVITQVMDVTRFEDFEESARIVENEWSGIDLVFNNAGIAIAGKMEETSLDEWKRVIDVDLWSVIYGCKVFIPMLKRQNNGYIINTASSAGTLAAAEMAGYNVAKAGVVSLSETLRVELSPNNIGVTVVCPTVFKTGLDRSINSESKMGRKLIKQLHESTVTSEDILRDILTAIDKRKLYVMTQADARWGWRVKRFFPELAPRIFSYLYINKKWIFAD